MSKDTQEYDIAMIRKLLINAFTAKELRRFCQDRSFLSPVSKEFAPNDGLFDLADKVIDYCETRDQFPELMDEVKKVNPRKYENFIRGESKLHTKQRSRIWIIAGIVGVALLGMLVGILIVGPIGDAITRLKAPDLPLQDVFHRDFEDVQDPTYVDSWITFPLGKDHRLSISNEQAHSGQSSLRLKVDIERYDPEVYPDEFGGIGFSASDEPELGENRIAACVAWVLLPRTEQTQDSIMFAHVYGEISEENQGSVSTYSEDVKLIPGAWTPIFWGATYAIDAKDFSFWSSSQRTDWIFLSVFDYSQSYKGSVYIDDIVCYANQEQ